MCSRVIIAVVALCVTSYAFGDEKAAARRSFLGKNPGTRLYRTQHRITGIYGKAFGTGNSAVDSAERFRKSRAAMFGLTARDLRAGNRFNQQLTQPVMYDAQNDSYKFTLVYYRQFFNDIPVYRCELRLLAANKPGYPLVWGRAHVRELGGFSVDPNAKTLDRDVLEALASAENPWLTNFTAPLRVIWAGIDDQVDQPRLAFELIGDNFGDGSGEPQKWLFVMDALNGEIVHLEDQIQRGTDDITGNTSAYATDDFRAQECGTESLTPLPYAKVEVVDGNSTYADVNGDFVIDHSGTADVTVRSHITGKWFTVFDAQNGNSHETIDKSVTPPGPVNFEHNDFTFDDEFITAQVNAYIQANLARDTVLAANPMYPTIWTQEGFHINVNGGSSCTNNYSGDAINFRPSSSSCNNGAFGTIVHHEYGHHLVQVAGSGQLQYGEGMGDAMGVVISGVSGFAIGKDPSDCGKAARDAASGEEYPCAGGGKYVCGQILSGCVWDTREAFILADPTISLDVLRDLTVNSILLHTGKKITPQIYIDWLVLDDDDGDLTNGTPHGGEIYAGFFAHSMIMALPGGANSGATVFTWTDEAPSDESWEHSCNWQPPVPTCSGDYPQDAVDVAFIDGSSGAGDVELVGDITIAKLGVSRNVTFVGSTIPESTLQVKAFVIYGDEEPNDVVVEVTSATIKQLAAP